PGGFLWKPVSDSDGRLAILTPEKLTGQIAGVSVKDPSGRVIESGRPAGVGNGDREHFRFSRPGGAFPPGSVVEIKLKNGETVNYTIPNPSERYD
ncbi:hypothetical protein L6R52_39655, partial [Myxococcota bacterium]|nr:hypothetical protein [Myxococcota bacterium]